MMQTNKKSKVVLSSPLKLRHYFLVPQSWMSMCHFHMACLMKTHTKNECHVLHWNIATSYIYWKAKKKSTIPNHDFQYDYLTQWHQKLLYLQYTKWTQVCPPFPPLVHLTTNQKTKQNKFIFLVTQNMGWFKRLIKDYRVKSN